MKPMMNPAMVKLIQPMPSVWSGTMVLKILSIGPKEISAVWSPVTKAELSVRPSGQA